MALHEEPGSSRSLVRSRHCCGDLLAYFLGPGTAWELRFEDVVIQVLKENRRHLETKHAKVATSLGNCSRRRTNLWGEFDATSEAMQMVTDRASGVELEHQLNSYRPPLLQSSGLSQNTRISSKTAGCRKRRPTRKR